MLLGQGGTSGSLTLRQIDSLYLQEYERLMKDPEIESNPELKNNLEQSRKLIAMLSHLQLQDRIKKCLQLGATDYWLPITSFTDLELSPGEHSKVENFQSTFLQNTYDMHQLEGQHASLSSGATRDCYHKFTLPCSFVDEGFIGRGAHGLVIRVKVMNEAYILKMFHRSEDPEARAKQAQGEIQVMKKVLNGKLRHSVNIVGSYTDPKTIGIIMSPVARHNLRELLEEYGLTYDKPQEQRIEERNRLAKLFGCLAAAVHELHYHLKIRHKDIKPANILIDHKGSVLLTDYGLSLNWELHGRTTTQEEAQKTMQYCAPEVAKGPGAPKRSSSDIWSLGCVFLEIIAVMSGKSISFVTKTMDHQYYFANLEGLDEILLNLKHGQSSFIQEPLEWTEQMLDPDETARPKARTLLKMIHKKSGVIPYWDGCCNPDSLGNNEPVSPSQGGAGISASSSGSAIPPGSTLSPRLPAVGTQCGIHHQDTGKYEYFDMIESSTAEHHWISRGTRKRIGLELKQEKSRPQKLNHQGEVYHSDQYIEATWTIEGTLKIYRNQRFYVCTDRRVPFKVIVSKIQML